MDPNLPTISANQIDAHLNTDRLNAIYKMADTLHKAGCFSGDIQNPQQAFVKIQAGAEMGLTPMEAMSDTALIKGNLTFHGKGLVKRFRKYKYKMEYKDETADGVTVYVDNGQENYTEKVLKTEVMAMDGHAIKKDPKSKMRYHGLARIARQYIPEILGSISYVADEVIDGDFQDVKPVATEGANGTTGTNLDAITAPVVEVKVDVAKEGSEKTVEVVADAATGEIIEKKDIPSTIIAEIKRLRSHTVLKSKYDATMQACGGQLPKDVAEAFAAKSIQLKEKEKPVPAADVNPMDPVIPSGQNDVEADTTKKFCKGGHVPPMNYSPINDTGYACFSCGYRVEVKKAEVKEEEDTRTPVQMAEDIFGTKSRDVPIVLDRDGKLAKLNDLMEKTKSDVQKMHDHFMVNSASELTDSQLDACIGMLEPKLK